MLEPRAGELAGVGVSGQQHGLVPLDRQRAVVRAAKLWCDTATAAEARELSQRFGGHGDRSIHRLAADRPDTSQGVHRSGNGDRSDPLMAANTRLLDDGHIAALAAYVSAME